MSNFVIKPLPDLISQLQDKMWEWPGDVTNLIPTCICHAERCKCRKVQMLETRLVQYQVVAIPWMRDYEVAMYQSSICHLMNTDYI